MPPRAKPSRKSQRKISADQSSEPFAFRLTHPDRVVFPDPGITKRDLANYYVAVADWIVPHVAGRPLALVRCPSGAAGECFFQKHPLPGMPASVDRIEIQEKSGPATYVMIHDLEGLIALVQFGTLEIHAWGSSEADIEHPDRMVFDLDPDPSVPWKEVISAAKLTRQRLADIRLKSFVKTTGGKGLHVVVPLAGRQTWPEVKQFAKAFADQMVADDPNRFIATMSKAARRGKIFIDYLRNERGATSVVSYSTRARAGAPVSMPISWEELGKLRDPQQFTVENAPARLTKRRRDPWQEIGKVRQVLNLKREPVSVAITTFSKRSLPQTNGRHKK
ncbi:MAG TPA: non-homologous end-joining DNA ligase [Pirellulales bacterium]